MDSLNRVEHRLKTYFLSVLFSFSLGIIYLTNRLGTEDLLALSIVKSISFLVIIVLLPEYFSNKINKIRESITIEKLSVLLVVVASLSGLLISQVSIKIPFLFWPIIALSLLTWLVLRYIEEFKSIFKIKFILLSLLSTLSFVMIGQLFWSSHYHTYYPELLLDGPMDTYYHVAISNLIKTYHTITTGLHGTLVLKYHVGSHLLFGGISSLLNIKSIEFYNLSYPIIFIPLYFKFLLSFIRVSSSYFNKEFNFLISTLIVLIIHLGLFPYLFSVHPYVSESSFISIILLIVFFTGLTDLISNYNKRGLVAKLLYLIGLYMLVCITKFSAGFFLTLIIVYCFFKTIRLQNSLRIRISIIIMLLFFVIYSFWITNVEIYKNEFMLISFYNYQELKLKDIVKLIMDIKFIYPVVLHFIFITMLIFILYRRNKFKKIKSLIYSNKFILVEALFFCFAVLYFVDFSLLISGGVVNDSDDYFYFNLPPLIISIFLFLSVINMKLSKGIIYILSSGFILFFSINIYTNEVRVYRQEIALELKEDHIRKIERAEIVKVLYGLSELSKYEKRTSILYIPKENKYFWKENEDWLGWAISNRSKMPFIPGAYSGLAQLNSFPLDTFVWNYSFNTYNINKNYSIKQAKKDANKMGYSTLFILKEESNKLKIDTINLDNI